MKIKEGFVLRQICGENVVSGEGMKKVDFTKLISLNPTAAYLWENIEGKDFTAETLADLLCSHYEVDRERALNDAKALCDTFVENGIVE